MSSSSESEEHSEGESPNEASGRSPWLKRALGFGLVALVLVGLALPRIDLSDDADEADEADGPEAANVEAHVIEPSTIADRLRTTGSLRSEESVELTSETAGRVTDIHFEEGTQVEEGDLLLQVNDSDLQAERRRLEFQLELAEMQEERQRQLLDEGGVSQEEYDRTRNEVNVLQAEVELMESRIEQTRVRAPFTGFIGLRDVSKGSYISPESHIATLQSIDPIKIDFSVPERHSNRMQPGDEISFSVRGSDASHSGEVYALEPRIDRETRTMRLRARADNPDGMLRPGAFADVTIFFDQIDDALMVPSLAVLPELGGQRVYIARNGEAQMRDVEIGVRTDTHVQVTEGLAPGDTVITSRLQELRPNMPVQVESLE